MKIAVATDHAGFPLKAKVLDVVRANGHEAIDLTPELIPDDDYPDVARVVGESIQKGEAERGVLLCGSGVGASVAASKMRGIRAAVCHDTYSAHQGVEHDDMNVLTLGGRVIGPGLLTELITAFLNATFSGEPRHVRRLAKIDAVERLDEGRKKSPSTSPVDPGSGSRS
jgi:ribose 5-phosphate isomerase B